MAARNRGRVSQFGGIEAIARSKPIDEDHLLDLRLMAHLHFDAILRGAAQTPTRDDLWTQATQWLALVMSGAAIAQRMKDSKRRHDQGHIAEAVAKRSERAYLAYSDAVIKAAERGSDRVIMTAEQLDVSRSFLHLYTQLLGVITVGQLTDAATATAHGIQVFRDVVLE